VKNRTVLGAAVIATDTVSAGPAGTVLTVVTVDAGSVSMEV